MNPPPPKLLAAHVEPKTANRFRSIAGRNGETVAARLRKMIAMDVAVNWKNWSK